MEQSASMAIGIKMTNPLTQIDDEIREMTDEEFAEYQKVVSVNPQSESSE